MKKKYFFGILLGIILIIGGVVYWLKYNTETFNAEVLEGGPGSVVRSFSGKVLDYDANEKTITIEIDDEYDEFQYAEIRLHYIGDQKELEDLGTLNKGDIIRFSLFTNQSYSRDELNVFSIELSSK